jgi:hypothetical protein
MILGFTGTRQGMTTAQRAALPSVLATLPARVLHGGAVGADEEFDAWLLQNGMNVENISILPGAVLRERFWSNLQRKVYAARAPLERNRLIMENCNHLLAVPAEYAEVLRSGTWATVRYARVAKKPITLILPDGSVKEENRWQHQPPSAASRHTWD